MYGGTRNGGGLTADSLASTPLSESERIPTVTDERL